MERQIGIWMQQSRVEQKMKTLPSNVEVAFPSQLELGNPAIELSDLLVTELQELTSKPCYEIKDWVAYVRYLNLLSTKLRTNWFEPEKERILRTV